jgi:hypothetical protein
LTLRAPTDSFGARIAFLRRFLRWA